MAKRELVTAATNRALSVPDFRRHARIDDIVEDGLLANFLDTAESAAENFTWRKFMPQTWDEYFDGFRDPLRLAFGPVTSVTSISYTDGNGDSQTLSTSIYELGRQHDVPIIRRKYNQVWPVTRLHYDMVVVRFVVGYTSVPPKIIQAIAIHANWQYRFRGEVSTEPPEAFYRLLRPYRLQRFMACGAT